MTDAPRSIQSSDGRPVAGLRGKSDDTAPGVRNGDTNASIATGPEGETRTASRTGRRRRLAILFISFGALIGVAAIFY